MAPTEKSLLVSTNNPLLIKDHKFDIRLYVCIASLEPLRVYWLDDGLVRFATKSYSNASGSLTDRHVHLTNVSVNRQSKRYVDNADASCNDVGSKWSWKALQKYLSKHFGEAAVMKLVAEMKREDGTIPLVQLAPEWEDTFNTYQVDVNGGNLAETDLCSFT